MTQKIQPMRQKMQHSMVFVLTATLVIAYIFLTGIMYRQTVTTVEEEIPVSYTHLDVYKRQVLALKTEEKTAPSCACTIDGAVFYDVHGNCLLYTSH